MTFGYALDYGHAIVVLVNLAIETVMIMLLYPLFVFSVRKLMVINPLKGFMHRMHETAMAAFAPYAPLSLAAVMILIVVAGRMLERSARDGRGANAPDQRESDVE